MRDRQPVSVIVPTLNEADNISLLLQRLDATFTTIQTPYEVLIIDDHSSDDTMMIATSLAGKYPVRAYLKKGARGKAQSLLEGFEAARYPLTAMIDADLQYAPEELAPMYELLSDTNADVIITDRLERASSPLRKLMTKTYNLLFARLLFGIKFDTQSGLKLFKSSVMDSIRMQPSPWTFDLEFLVRALEHKRKIISHTISFNERHAGITKVKVLSSSLEMAKASLQLRWRTSHRKTREGYRANNRFIKRALGTSLSTFVFALLAANFVTGLVPKTSAAALPGSGIIHSIEEALGITSVSNQSVPQASSQQPAATSSTTSSQPSTTTSQSAAINGQTTAATSNRTSSTSGTTQTGHSVTSQPASNAESGSLGAATATNKIASAYSGSYPYYTLSASSSGALSRAAKAALIGGSVCLVTAISVIAYRLRRTHTYFKSLKV